MQEPEDPWASFRDDKSEEGGVFSETPPVIDEPGFWKLVGMVFTINVWGWIKGIFPRESQSSHGPRYLSRKVGRDGLIPQKRRAARRRVKEIEKAGANPDLAYDQVPIILFGHRVSYVFIILVAVAIMGLVKLISMLPQLQVS